MKAVSKDRTDTLHVDQILSYEQKYNDYEYPRVSIIIPTFNNAEKIPGTLESILLQKYPDFEVIIVDGGSDDRTLEFIQNFRDERIFIYSISGFQRYEMLNKGLSQANGEYVNCLFPGDFYIHKRTLLMMMEVALDNESPHLVYCGTLIRDGKSDPKNLLRPFSLGLLKKGLQPTSLQSCWFRLDTLKTLGKFNTSYQIRGGFDLMCRFALQKDMRVVYSPRILTDYDLRLVTRKMVYNHFVETLKTIRKHFGIGIAFRWFFVQKDFTRLLRSWSRGIKAAFIGR